MEDGSNTTPMPLLNAYRKYTFCLLVTVSIIAAAIMFNLPDLAGVILVEYFVCGIYLNHTVLRELVEWHPVNGTINNVFQAKWNAVVAWPFIYFSLLFKLTINKVI
jgi:hypothetical protein